MIHELGLERRETVWSLSAVKFEKTKELTLVREDQDGLTNGRPITSKVYVGKLSWDSIITE